MESKLTAEDVQDLLQRIEKLEEQVASLQGRLDVLNGGEASAGSDASGIVYSAVPLEPTMIAEMERQTGKLLKKKVSLKNRIDKEIIGGFVIAVDRKVLDASLRKRLHEMNDHILTEHLTSKEEESL